MKKVLFIDRDGTLISEPQDTFQVDNFGKLIFIKQVITFLSKIRKEMDYEFVMVTNQDGLGTASFPESDFWPIQNFMMKVFENEGITFDAVFIDRSFPEQNLPTRKPGTAMVSKYLNGNYDLANSFVIGDRITDVEFAKNIGCKAILFNSETKETGPYSSVIELVTDSWETIYNFLRGIDRKVICKRTTSETQISLFLNLDGKGVGKVGTGIPFFDHMLEQLIRHGNMDLFLNAKGDLQIDSHHTIEDCGILLGQAFYEATTVKIGLNRYGFELPMDESLAKVAVDFGGRSYFKWSFKCPETTVADIPVSLFEHFFRSFAEHARINLHIKVKGRNAHHGIEAAFKAFARAVKMAVQRNSFATDLPTTKGLL